MCDLRVVRILFGGFGWQSDLFDYWVEVLIGLAEIEC